MRAASWKKVIKENCIQAGTYRECFDPVIKTLAAIMEKRDMAQKQFDDGGGEIIVEHTNKAGATNLERNPALLAVNELNRDALQYWRDLGLTPAGLKKINENAMRARKKNSLADVLKSLE